MIDIVKISKALGDPIRYKIMTMLQLWEKQNKTASHTDDCYSGVCNCEIMAKFGMIQSRVSYHMKELVDAGLVSEEQRGKWKFYTLNKQGFKKYIKAVEQEFLD